jgi:S-adenosylmethionine:tRNA ribosyltransferase-isomerase
MHPKQVKIKDYDYDLPAGRIAKYPLSERDSSKLLVYKKGEIAEETYKELDQYIPEKSLLIFNNTKVIFARLNFKNSTGAKIEVFCLEPAEKNAEQASAMSQEKSVEWTCLIGRASKWKEKTIQLETENLTLKAEILEKIGDSYKIKFSWDPETLSFAEVLDKTGEMPIPPYLKRKSEEIDSNRYQTVYAKHKGSVAAPTAGLHFTASIFEKLNKKNTIQDYVTLHVGAGTFKPVKTETIAAHDMHSEWIEVRVELIENLIQSLTKVGIENNIIAIGTTSLRTIESLYWMGVKASLNTNSTIHELEVQQWDPYELPKDLSSSDSLKALRSWLKKNKLEQLTCKTQIIIVPPYELKIADALITNFHQPKSTLLLLISAVVGDEWKTIYNYALENNFRFLSYGDGSILFKK